MTDSINNRNNYIVLRDNLFICNSIVSMHIIASVVCERSIAYGIICALS